MAKLEFDSEHEDTVHLHVPQWVCRLRAAVRFWTKRTMCRVTGLHDYEAVSSDGPWVVLECFYCLKRKNSYMREYDANQ